MSTNIPARLEQARALAANPARSILAAQDIADLEGSNGLEKGCANGGTERTDHDFHAVGLCIRRGARGDGCAGDHCVDRCERMGCDDNLALVWGVRKQGAIFMSSRGSGGIANVYSVRQHRCSLFDTIRRVEASCIPCFCVEMARFHAISRESS